MAKPASTPNLEDMLARRRGGAAMIRDLTDGTGTRRSDAEEDEKPFSSPFGWLVGVAGSVAAIAVVLMALLAVPPLLECRSHFERGFFSGQTFGSCVSSGVSARSSLLEERVKKVLLASGR